MTSPAANPDESGMSGDDAIADRLFATLRVYAHLHGAQSVRALFTRAADAVCQECDYDRAIVLSVEDQHLTAAHTGPLATPASDRLRRALRSLSVPLAPGTTEHQAVGRAAVGPRDPCADRSALADVLKLRYHGFAAIIVDGATCALLVVDRSLRPVGAADLAQADLIAEQIAAELVRLSYRARLDACATELAQELSQIAEAAHKFATRLRQPPYGLSPRSSQERPKAQPGGGASLTDREEAVMRLLIDGRTNPEIGETLGLSSDTIKTHVRRISRKLGALNRVEAVSLYLKRVDR